VSRPPQSGSRAAGPPQRQTLSGIPPQAYGRSDLAPHGGGPANLADILERVLDKGIVIAGDIQINLLEIELLTIRLRLLVASVDRAREMGINWWEADSSLSVDAKELERENKDLRQRLDRIERMLDKQLPAGEGDGRGKG
jgi:hypothetical protein